MLATAPFSPFRILLISSLLAQGWVAGAAAAIPNPPPTKNHSQAVANYGNLPLSFEANQGQTAPSVQFLVHGQGYTLFLRPGEAILALQPANAQSEAKLKSPIVQIKLAGANLKSPVVAEDPQITRTNYFLGNNPTQWHTDIPNYSRIRYRSVYNGIDLVYYGNQRRLEHDFIVAPYADPSKIILSLKGEQTAHIDRSSGDLILKTSLGDIHLLRPVAYQKSNGRRTEIASAYKLLAHHRIGFSLSAYDRGRLLIIDPVLTYSTYLGGSGSNSIGGVDQGNGAAVDPDGNAYIVGSTQSADFPVTGGVYQPTNHAQANYPYRNAFVSKLNATGTQLIFSTYLGGSDNGPESDELSGDQGIAIALDSDSNVYVAGYTKSPDFPTTPGAFQTVNYNELPGGSKGPTAFAAKLNVSGTQLEYSTFLGGHAPVNSYLGDKAVALAVDSSNNAYIAGTTSSPDFPVSAGAFQTSTASQTAAFVTKLNPTGTALVYSTFLGSPADSKQPGVAGAAGVALDDLGNCYITGTTSAVDFPVTAGAFQVVNNAVQFNGSDFGDPFVTKLNPSGSALIYSTYLGGGGDGYNYVGDSAQAIAVDSSGSAYVAGTSVSANFPIQGGIMQPFDSNGPSSGFLAKFNPSGTALDYSTRIGGSNSIVAGLAVDGSGKAFVFGLANPLYFPIPPDGNLVQKTSPSQPNGIFLAKVSAAGNALEYATQFGGTGMDTPGGIAVDAAGDVFLTGSTYSTNFPVTSGALQTVNKGAANYAADGFVSELSLAAETNDHVLTQLALSVSAATVNQGTPLTITATTASAVAEAATGNIIFTAAASSPMPFSATSVALDANGVATLTTSTLAPGNYTLYATYAGDNAHLSANSSIQPNGIISFQVVGAPAHISWQYLFSGPFGYGTSGWEFAALVTDAVGDPVSGAQVAFSGGSINFSSATAITNAYGYAQVYVSFQKAGTLFMYAHTSGIQNPAVFQAVVTPVPLTVTLRGNWRYYGAAIPAFTYVVTGLVGSDTVTVTPQSTATAASPVSIYPVTAVVSGPDAANYTITVVNTLMQVRKAPLYVQARDDHSIYGQTPPPPTAYYIEGFVNGDTAATAVTGAPVLTTTVTAATPCGSYRIGVQIGTLAAANYYFNLFGNGEGLVNVAKATLEAVPNSLTMTQGGPVPPLTYTVTGFLNGDTAASALTGAPVLTTAVTSATPRGHYSILLTRGTLAAQNYYIQVGDGVMTILP